MISVLDNRVLSGRAVRSEASRGMYLHKDLGNIISVYLETDNNPEVLKVGREVKEAMYR